MSAVVEDVPLVDNIKSSIEPTPSNAIHEKEKDVTLTDEVIKNNKEEEKNSTLVCDQKEEVLDNDDKEPKKEVDTATIEENKDSPKRSLEEGDDNDEIPLPLTKASRTMSVVS